jgi:hypothetical protein
MNKLSFIPLKQAASILGRSYRSMRYHVYHGMPSIKKNNRIYVNLSQCKKYFKHLPERRKYTMVSFSRQDIVIACILLWQKQSELAQRSIEICDKNSPEYMSASLTVSMSEPCINFLESLLPK